MDRQATLAVLSLDWSSSRWHTWWSLALLQWMLTDQAPVPPVGNAANGEAEHKEATQTGPKPNQCPIVLLVRDTFQPVAVPLLFVAVHAVTMLQRSQVWSQS